MRLTIDTSANNWDKARVLGGATWNIRLMN